MQNKKKIIGGTIGLLLSSPFLLHLTSGFEGTRYKTYRDPVGIPTVCEGITGVGVIEGKTYTRAECDALLKSRMEIAGRGVLSCVKTPINQNQYNAFTDLAYNIGTGAFCRSSIAKEANLRNYTAACNNLMLYDKAGGKVLLGLVKRREAERKLCLTPVQTVAKS